MNTFSCKAIRCATVWCPGKGCWIWSHGCSGVMPCILQAWYHCKSILWLFAHSTIGLIPQRRRTSGVKPGSQYVDRPLQMRLFNEAGSRSLVVSPEIRRASKQGGWWRLSIGSVSSNGISQTRQSEAMEIIKRSEQRERANERRIHNYSSSQTTLKQVANQSNKAIALKGVASCGGGRRCIERRLSTFYHYHPRSKLPLEIGLVRT